MPDKESYGFMAGRNINGYFTYHLFINFAFWLSIYAVFFMDRGLDFSALLLLYVVVNGFQTLMELPSGMLADKWGRKPVMMLGALMQASGYLLIAFGDSMYWYIPGMSLAGIAHAFTSGSDSAFIYDSLVAAKREEEFKKIEGRAYMFSLIGWGAGGLLGGWIAMQNLALPYILSAMTSLMAMFIIGTCVEPPRVQLHMTARAFIHNAWIMLRDNRRVRGIIIFSSILYGLLLACHKFSQPYLLSAGIALEVFGVIYFVWLIGAALSSNFSERIEQLLGRKTIFYLMPVLAGGAIIYLGVRQDIFGAFIALLYQFSWGALRPQMNHVINDEVASTMRATILSVAGFGSSIIYIITAPLIGEFADLYGFDNALLLLGMAILTLGLIAAHYFLFSEKPD
ncbi:MAG: MFS transporter [candidate division Zixibacteria bacterium]|nr:MFS transporter [candidate division Zixibacteria bacterium]